MLTHPIYDDFVTHDPTVEQQTKVITSTEFANQTGSPYDPGNVVAIIDNRFVNAARQRIKGIDVSGSYRFDLENSRLTVRGSVSWLNSEKALTSTSMHSASAGNLTYPASVTTRVCAVLERAWLTPSSF